MSASEQWGKLKSLFAAASDLPAHERRSYVESLNLNSEQKDQLLGLLEADSTDHDQFELFRSRDLCSDQAARDLEGEQLEEYRVLHRIGSGGMGTVYLAERQQSGVTQRVALKVVQRGLLDSAALERFHRERLILARLDHPYICRLTDAGVTADGRPYFVMPFLDGARDIIDYSNHARIGPSERIAVFIRVCEAVHYAHQNLVVHSDLKPGNLLVLPNGHVQLVDFGVSRLLTPEQVGFTQQLGSNRPITPNYASPEQLQGEPPTTACDVYALGVLLFELLFGRKPYEIPVDRPFTRWPEYIGVPAHATLSSPVSIDLHTICTKAMQKDPGQRYSSAVALSDDLERWLSGAAVLARGPSIGYRLSRFVRRHRWPVAAGITGLVAVLAVAAVTTFSTITLSEQAERIALERDRAESTARFWADLFEQTDPANAQQASDSVDELLTLAIARLQTDEDLSVSSRVRLLNVISTSYWHRADPDSALAAAQAATDAAGKSRDHPDARAAAFRQLANIHGSRAELADARAAADQALAALAELPSPDPQLEAQVLDADALILDMEGETAKAAARLERVIALQRKLPARIIRSDHATALGNLAYMYYRLSRSSDNPDRHLARASELVARSIELLRAEYGETHPRVAFMYNASGVIHRERGSLQRALNSFESARDISGANLPIGHEALTRLRLNIGSVHKELGNYSQSAEAYQSALDHAELPDGHPDTRAAMIGAFQGLYLAGDWRSLAAVVSDTEAELAHFPGDDSVRSWWHLMSHMVDSGGNPDSDTIRILRAQAEQYDDQRLHDLLARIP